MQLSRIITCITALGLVMFLNTAMAKSDKSGRGHKSDRHSERSAKSHKSHKSHKSDKSHKSGKSCKSNKSGRGRGHDGDRYGCEGSEDPPASNCTATIFPGGYREGIPSVGAGTAFIDLEGYVCANSTELPDPYDYVPFWGSIRCDKDEPFFVDPENLGGPWEDFQLVRIQYTCIGA
jgi:hypothetical protein